MPTGVALDSKDNLYVADTYNNRIQKIQPDGNITSIGEQGSELGEFYLPYGIALDSKDNLYVADTKNNRIQKFSLFQIWKFELGNTN
ncbi:MAG TPA: NHL repeat-containing protein [Nitrososphaeraceae archaeon]|nr:NHL repeat-containing protein [Nitrososphaeraceae archaeon]